VARKLTVQAEEIAEFADVLRVLRLVRDLGAKPLDLQLDDSGGNLMVAIPVLADADEDIAKLKPNPLTRVVSVRANNQVALNGDQQDSFEALLVRLRELFRRRTEKKAYKPVDDAIEFAEIVRNPESIASPARGINGLYTTSFFVCVR